MNHIEAMKQALEALALIVAVEWTPAFTRKEYDSDEPEENKLRDRVLTAITTLRTAIEQAEKQEPVGVVRVLPLGDGHKPMHWADWTDADNPPPENTPLYTTPPSAQEEIQRLSALIRAQQITIDKLEAQLRERNAGETK